MSMETQTVDIQSAPTTDSESWLRSICINAKAAPAPLHQGSRLAVGVLLGVIVALAMVVRAELADVPEGAIAGLLLRAQISIAELMPAASGVVVEVEQRPLSLAQSARSSKSGSHSHRLLLARHRATAHATPESSPMGGFQLLPIRPLKPFDVEVVSGRQHRFLNARSGAVQIDVDDSESLPPGSAPQPPSGAATLRAVISAQGQVEDLWLVHGPRPTSGALSNIRHGQYRPFVVDGRPVEMEALIVVATGLPGSAISNVR